MNQFTQMMQNSNFEGLMNQADPTNQSFDQSQAAFLQQNQPQPNHIPHKVEFTVWKFRFLDSFLDLSHAIRNFGFSQSSKKHFRKNLINQLRNFNFALVEELKQYIATDLKNNNCYD